MKKIELLAPAGNIDSLKAAVYAGCDAVYLGGKLFGARGYSENFDDKSLQEATDFCHLYGVKVYITVNTLLYEAEVKSFMKYIDILVEMHVDALILQDLGMIDLIHQTYPDLELHASTQMNIHNVEGVLLAESLGMKRVVLAREVQVKLIREIKEKTNIEIEVFGHGALCVGYSGQCLMSSLIGGRSGNRGTCAQCCRQKYSLHHQDKILEKEAYLLSTKDLNIIDHLEEFIQSGIDSLKIEGRMKRPEYVYLVVSIYRKMLDMYYKNGHIHVLEEDKQALKAIFNRGFTKGFLFNEQNEDIVQTYRPNHIGTFLGKVAALLPGKISILLTEPLYIKDGIRIINDKEDQGLTVYKMWKQGKEVNEGKKGDVIEISFQKPVSVKDSVYKTTSIKQMKEIEEALRNRKRQVPIVGKINIQIGKPIHLELQDFDHKVTVHSEENVELSKTSSTCKADLLAKISKLGDTVYKLEALEVNMEDGSFVPAQWLNQLRRDAILKLNTERLKRETISKKIYQKKVPTFDLFRHKSVYIHTLGAYNLLQNSYDGFIYAESPLYEKISEDPRTVQKLPRIMQNYPIIKTPLLVGELGSLYTYNSFITDFSFGVTNSYTMALLHTLGAQRVTLSHELNEAQIKKMIEAYQKRYHQNPNAEWIIYGNEEAMITKYNPLLKHKIKEGILKDRFGNEYIIKDHDDHTILYHYQTRNQKEYEIYYQIGVSTLCFHILKNEEMRNIMFLK